MDAQQVADELGRELASAGTAERAEQSRRYLKSEVTFLGATVPAIRAAVQQTRRSHAMDHGDVIALTTALWEVSIHERRMAAVILLERDRALFSPADLPLLERLLRQGGPGPGSTGSRPTSSGRSANATRRRSRRP